MNINIYKAIYWFATTLLIVLFLTSAGLNLFSAESVAEFYDRSNFPLWLIIPSAIIKIAGVAIIIRGKPRLLKEWAYACLFFDAVLAFSAHQIAGDGQWLWSLLAGISIMVSRIFEEKAYPEQKDLEVINL